MKKLMVLMIAIFTFAIASSGALADEPANSALDRHSVWKSFIDERTPPPAEPSEFMGSSPASGQMATPESESEKGKTGESPVFDFIRETDSYDYSRDRDNSA